MKLERITNYKSNYKIIGHPATIKRIMMKTGVLRWEFRCDKLRIVKYYKLKSHAIENAKIFLNII
jgi:hypothetical protein